MFLMTTMIKVENKTYLFCSLYAIKVSRVECLRGENQRRKNKDTDCLYFTLHYFDTRVFVIIFVVSYCDLLIILNYLILLLILLSLFTIIIIKLLFTHHH